MVTSNRYLIDILVRTVFTFPKFVSFYLWRRLNVLNVSSILFWEHGLILHSKPKYTYNDYKTA